MADLLYNSYNEDILAGNIVLGTDTFKIMLVTSAYTPDSDAHQFRAAVTNEITGGGYTAGGVTLANVAVTRDDANDVMRFDADDAVFSSLTNTFRAAVIYKDTGNVATDNLVCYLDFTSDQTSNGGDATINFDTAGIVVHSNSNP